MAGRTALAARASSRAGRGQEAREKGKAEARRAGSALPTGAGTQTVGPYDGLPSDHPMVGSGRRRAQAEAAGAGVCAQRRKGPEGWRVGGQVFLL